MMRLPSVAGTFYPDNEIELRKMIADFLEAADAKKIGGKLRGLIVPHAGYVYSGPVAAYAYKLLEGKNAGKIILIGPSHYGIFNGLAESGYQKWQTPIGELETFSIGLNRLPKAHDPEHSLEVQLPFLQIVLKNFKIDPILTGDLSPKEGAKTIDINAFFIVSSDLSHYYPYEQAMERDKKTISLIESLDAENFLTGGDACGRMGIAMIMELARQKGWKIKLLKYANSGDTAGPKTEVVGYAAFAVIE
ncbi:AmmeMemoRadiSam system protein B [Candidatus Micrarchaeota archaeon]|nr:AmmeMemoRadiSam system protein B [Candidatus Micrarchaeota archaeon]